PAAFLQGERGGLSCALTPYRSKTTLRRGKSGILSGHLLGSSWTRPVPSGTVSRQEEHRHTRFADAVDRPTNEDTGQHEGRAVMMPRQRFQAGDSPIPGYDLLHILGRGGFGEVWKVKSPGGLPKAIKIVSGNLNVETESGQATLERRGLERIKQ